MIRTVLKRWEFWIFFLIGVFFLFAFIKSANASFIVGQNSVSSTQSNTVFTDNAPQRWAAFFLNADDINTVSSSAATSTTDHIKFRYISDTDYFGCSILFRWNGNQSQGYFDTQFTPETCSSYRTITSIGGGKYLNEWDIPCSAIATCNNEPTKLKEITAIGIRPYTGAGNGAYTYGDSGTTYNERSKWNEGHTATLVNDSSVYAFWFELELEGEAIQDYSIDWLFPVNSTSTTDFGFWRFNIISQSDFYLQIHYYTDDYSQEYVDTGGLYMATGTSTLEKAVLKSNALSYGPWNAEAFLISDDFGTTFAQTDIISFTITTGTTAIPLIEASTTCSGLGWIGEPICNLSFLLFVPKQSSLNNFSNLKATLENKPPFGYATAIYGALTGFASSTATSSLDALNLVAFGNLPTTAPIKTTLTIIIWLMFGYWLFQRVRHFEF